MRPWALERRERLCVCVSVCKREEIKTNSREQKDEKSGREGVRSCAESSCEVFPSSAHPGPFFQFFQKSLRLAAPRASLLPRMKRHTNKQQTNQRGKTFIRLQLTG